MAHDDRARLNGSACNGVNVAAAMSEVECEVTAGEVHTWKQAGLTPWVPAGTVGVPPSICTCAKQCDESPPSDRNLLINGLT